MKWKWGILMNRTLSIVMIIAILLFTTVSCSTQKEPIKIGFTVGLTGFLADEGVSARNGFILAIEEMNAAGGLNGHLFEPVVKDDESTPEVGNQVSKAFSEEGVQFIIGHLLSSMYVSAEYGMSEHDLVFISPTMATNIMTGRDDNFFRVIGDTSVMAESIGNMVMGSEVTKLMIVFDEGNLGFSGTVKDVLVENLNAMSKIEIVICPYNEGDNFEELAEKMKVENIDGVAMITSSVATANILQQMAIKDVNIPRFTSTWALSSELVYKGGQATEGLYGVGFYDKDSQAEAFVAFNDNYVTRFSEEPSHTSYFAYEATMLLMDAFKRAESFDKDAVIKALKETGSFEGLSNTYVINKDGDAERPYVQLQIVNGEMKRVE